jgi:hypothetical protein
VKWLEKSHEATKEFFASFKECGSRPLITKLENDEGQNISSTTEIGEQCREFYVRQYVRQGTRDHNKEAREAFLNCMKC